MPDEDPNKRFKWRGVMGQLEATKAKARRALIKVDAPKEAFTGFENLPEPPSDYETATELETKNMMVYLSLPKEEQKKIRDKLGFTEEDMNKRLRALAYTSDENRNYGYNTKDEVLSFKDILAQRQK